MTPYWHLSFTRFFSLNANGKLYNLTFVCCCMKWMNVMMSEGVRIQLCSLDRALSPPKMTYNFIKSQCVLIVRVSLLQKVFKCILKNKWQVWKLLKFTGTFVASSGKYKKIYGKAFKMWFTAFIWKKICYKHICI